MDSLLKTPEQLIEEVNQIPREAIQAKVPAGYSLIDQDQAMELCKQYKPIWLTNREHFITHQDVFNDTRAWLECSVFMAIALESKSLGIEGVTFNQFFIIARTADLNALQLGTHPA